jgi:rhodanese-related sulfurtransferase
MKHIQFSLWLALQRTWWSSILQYMVNIFRIFVACFLLFPIGCNTGISDKNLSYIMPRDASILVQDGQNSILGPNSTVVIVDPRPTWSFRESHIPEAINIPYGRLRIQAWRLADVGMIIVSGETYNDSVAIAMSKTLMGMGFTDVRTLRGGLVGWGDAGESIETLE